MRRHPEYTAPRVREHVTTFRMPVALREYLDIEAKRLSEERGKKITMNKLVLELIIAYRERRLAGLITGPED